MLTEKKWIDAIRFLDKPPPIPILYYGGCLGLPLECFPDVPDGEVFGSFRHVKIKKIEQ